MKLYSDFLQSDIIVASPIALATKLSDEVEEGGPADFLSSIEIAIVDRADVQLMQNWAHVVTGAEPRSMLSEQRRGRSFEGLTVCCKAASCTDSFGCDILRVTAVHQCAG